MTFYRKTIADTIQLGGDGLHSGAPVDVAFKPGESGIVFYSPEGEVRADPSNVSNTERCTRLGAVNTVEHCMAALAAAEVTDVEIHLTAQEMPAMDGASRTYLDAIIKTGLAVLSEATFEGPFARVFARDGQRKVAIGSGQGHWSYRFMSETRWPFDEMFEMTALPEGFLEEVASARTWGFEDEVSHLHSLGLARGLDLTKALVLGPSGYVNESHWPDEATRHKLLDVIGDVYLSGIPIRFLNVSAEQSGHQLNVQAAVHLKEAVRLS